MMPAETELLTIVSLLRELGMTVDERQPHISGERSVQGGRTKYVLIGDYHDMRAVAKVSSSPEGIAEIEAEEKVRETLATLAFAQATIRVPKRLHLHRDGHYVVSITEFIGQKEVLRDKPLADRFFMSIRAFEAQDAFHAATYEHVRAIRGVFPIYTADTYIAECTAWKDRNASLESVLSRAVHALRERTADIERYSGFLTHSDFVPHNIRLDGRTLWFLDCASMRFGNKHESRARFTNYMLVHDRELADALLSHMHSEAPQEDESLRAMRIYKAAHLVDFYARTLPQTGGDLRTLTELRLRLWSAILIALIDGSTVDPMRIDEYAAQRNALRTPEERERQKEFNRVEG